MHDPRHRGPELLSPAGGPEALRAAVANGADAVYLGVDRLNARRGAQNFTLETLAEACAFAHLRGVSVYLVANVVVLPEEVPDALGLVDTAWEAGVDAVIVQDLGLLRLIRTCLPNVRVHASTQINTHSSSTVAELARMGVRRVTLAREVSVTEIASLVRAGHAQGVEIESFVHGALCMCYSGQCLLSSVIGGRSANRGQCAQPCRLAYELAGDDGAVRATPGAHLLSPKDLAGITLLPELIAAGVNSLKIEGRMKSPEYVAIVTGTYRAALDRALAAPDSFGVREGEMSVLADAFSRGFTEAYLVSERGNPMMSYLRPNNRGVFAGRITAIDGEIATIALEASISSADTIEVWTGRGRFAQTVGPIDLGGPGDRAPGGARVRIALEQPAAAGDRVFRVRNAELLDAAARTFAGDDIAPVPVSVEVRVVRGEPLLVRATTAWGSSASASGGRVEPARTRAVTSEDVIEHVGRFGGSGFAPVEWDVALSPDAGVGFSELHRVRRAALDALREELLLPWAGRRRCSPEPPRLRRAPRPERVRVVASVASADAARACLDAGADEVHVPAGEIGSLVDERVTALLPRICHDSEEPSVIEAAQGRSAVVAGTLGLLSRAAEPGRAVQAHWSLNATNAHAVAELAAAGATFVWLSPELTGTRIEAIAREAAVPVGVAVLGRQEVMVTEHCVLMAEGECSHACGTCRRRTVRHALRDRKGYEFPLITDSAGRTHLYNAVPLDLTGAIADVIATGVAAIRLDLETEDADAARAAVVRVRRALDATAGGGRRRDTGGRASTTGHFFRGVG